MITGYLIQRSDGELLSAKFGMIKNLQNPSAWPGYSDIRLYKTEASANKAIAVIKGGQSYVDRKQEFTYKVVPVEINIELKSPGVSGKTEA